MFGRMPMIQTQYCQYPYNRKERENNVLKSGVKCNNIIKTSNRELQINNFLRKNYYTLGQFINNNFIEYRTANRYAYYTPKVLRKYQNLIVTVSHDFDIDVEEVFDLWYKLSFSIKDHEFPNKDLLLDAYVIRQYDVQSESNTKKKDLVIETVLLDLGGKYNNE